MWMHAFVVKSQNVCKDKYHSLLLHLRGRGKKQEIDLALSALYYFLRQSEAKISYNLCYI